MSLNISYMYIHTAQLSKPPQKIAAILIYCEPKSNPENEVISPAFILKTTPDHMIVKLIFQDFCTVINIYEKP